MELFTATSSLSAVYESKSRKIMQLHVEKLTWTSLSFIFQFPIKVFLSGSHICLLIIPHCIQQISTWDCNLVCFKPYGFREVKLRRTHLKLHSSPHTVALCFCLKPFDSGRCGCLMDLRKPEDKLEMFQCSCASSTGLWEYPSRSCCSQKSLPFLPFLCLYHFADQLVFPLHINIPVHRFNWNWCIMCSEALWELSSLLPTNLIAFHWLALTAFPFFWPRLHFFPHCLPTDLLSFKWSGAKKPAMDVRSLDPFSSKS